MPTKQQWMQLLAALALTTGLSVGTGACEGEGEVEGEKDDFLYQDCLTVIAKNDTCMNQVFEGCDGCAATCADRGQDVANDDEHCGKLYTETYACLAALSCENFLKWTSHPDPAQPYPCQAEETSFRTDCPDFHHYNENN